MKSHPGFIVLFAASVSLTLAAPALSDYCSAAGGLLEYISGVEVGDISNIGTDQDGYADYTSLSTTMEPGVGYEITVTNGWPFTYDECGIWVDWNQDEDFYDTDEQITVTGTPGTGPYEATITPPPTALAGNTRMRIRITYNETPSPCGDTAYGEVEDYTITVEPINTNIQISGFVKTSLGVRIQAVNITASTGPNTVTDALGYYELILPNPFTGSITPSQMDWTFTPSSRAYSNATTDQVNQDFTATYTIGYGGGSGTSSSPYLIYNAAQLNAIGANAGDWDKYFRLVDDIDLSGYDGKEGRPAFNRIGYYINFVEHDPFTGVFYGGEHTISNFTFDSDTGNDAVGLFGYAETSTVTIQDTKLFNVDVNSTSGLGTGALIGLMDGGNVINCSVRTGTVSGQDDVGGLIGKTWGGLWAEMNISNCNADAVTVLGEWSIGGMLGSSNQSVSAISDCNASCIVNGQTDCGGLIGSAVGTVTRCKSTGTVTVTDRTGGGLSGENSGTIAYCFSTADVTGIAADEIGGLVGRNMEIITNSYANGDVSGTSRTGGLVGLNWKTPTDAGTITNCYSTGASNFAGLIGQNIDGIITASFWDTQTSGRTWSDGGTGKPTADMQTEATFVDAGWDFIIETANGDENIWYINPDDYPRFCWQAGIKYDGGTGTMDDPYLIYSGAQMNKIGTRTEDWNKSFKLMADISLAAYTGSSYNLIGRSSGPHGDGPFRGDFDGNYHSISGFTYSGTGSYKGLFGYVSDGRIKNLQIISPAITDPGYDDMTYVGPLVGCASGANIFSCSVVGGNVEGERYVGGLIGQSMGSFTADCSSSASVSGADYVGGLAGGPSVFATGLSQISNSCAHGDVSGNEYVGGLAGDSTDTMIVHCYSTGAISGANNVGGFSGYNENAFLYGVNNVIDCFWDVESSGEPNSAAATGLETAIMQDINTFLDAGWDFVEETDNGGSDDWAMPPGGGYPVHWYELTVSPPLPTFASGSGTAEDPYLIETTQQLNSIGHNPRLMDKHFKLISDIDMNSKKFYPIADRPYAFTGTFDGDNLTVSNIEISSQAFCARVGFIGYLYGTDAQIKNLTLYEPNLTAPLSWWIGSLTGMSENGTITNCHSVNANVFGWASVGGLVGINYWNSTISGCSATGDVLENDFLSPIFTGVGGLVGENSFWSEINNSFAKCNVSGQESLGGLVGNNLIYGVITNCYSHGTVTGTEECIGGFVGRTTGGNNTQYCYSASQVSGPEGGDGIGGFTGGRMGSGLETYTACFWDSEINPGLPGIGYGTDPNVIGQSTANMQMASTYIDEGWDFLDTWTIICEGTNYPRHQWLTLLPADFLCPEGVDFLDYAYFSDYWLDENCALSDDCDGTDFDLSDTVDANDLKIFFNYWLQGDN